MVESRGRLRRGGGFVLGLALIVASVLSSRPAPAEAVGPAQSAVAVQHTLSFVATDGVVETRTWTNLFVQISPGIAGVRVVLQDQASAASPWVARSALTTNSTGRATFRYRATTPGPIMLRVRATLDGQPVVSRSTVIAFVAVDPATPPAQDPALLLRQLNVQLCKSIYDSIDQFGALGTPLYSAVLTMTTTTLSRSQCEGKSYAESLRAGFTEGLIDFGYGKVFDTVAGDRLTAAIHDLYGRLGIDASTAGITSSLINHWLEDQITALSHEYTRCVMAAAGAGGLVRCAPINRELLVVSQILRGA